MRCRWSTSTPGCSSRRPVGGEALRSEGVVLALVEQDGRVREVSRVHRRPVGGGGGRRYRHSRRGRADSAEEHGGEQSTGRGRRRRAQGRPRRAMGKDRARRRRLLSGGGDTMLLVEMLRHRPRRAAAMVMARARLLFFGEVTAGPSYGGRRARPGPTEVAVLGASAWARPPPATQKGNDVRAAPARRRPWFQVLEFVAQGSAASERRPAAGHHARHAGGGTAHRRTEERPAPLVHVDVPRPRRGPGRPGGIEGRGRRTTRRGTST